MEDYYNMTRRFLPADLGTKKPHVQFTVDKYGTASWKDLTPWAEKSKVKIWNALPLEEALKFNGAACILLGDGIICLDVDVKKVDGHKTYANLREQYNLPSTYTESTPSGGAHYYFTVPKEFAVRNFNRGEMGAGIDLKATGGLCVFAGSRVEAGEYKPLNTLPINACPDALLADIIAIPDLKPEYTTPKEQLDVFAKVCEAHNIVPNSPGKKYVGSNPNHGSTGGVNFHVDFNKGVWHCFSSSCDNAGGGIMQLIGLLDLELECPAAAHLSPENRTRVKKIGTEKYGMVGLSIPEIPDVYSAKDCKSYIMGQYKEQLELEQIPTGIPSIDVKFEGGFICKDFYLYSGPTGSGKTRISTSLCHNALQRGKAVHFISLEMDPHELLYLVAAQALQLPYVEMKLARMSEQEMTKTIELFMAKQLPFYITKHSVGDNTTDISTIEKTMRDSVTKYGTKLFIVDYIQNITYSMLDGKTDGGASNQKYGYIVQKLNDLATELKVVIFALSQNNNSARAKDTPSFYHIAGSIKIPQIADNVMMGKPTQTGDIEIHVLKNRMSNLGVVQLSVDWRHNTVTDFDLPYETYNEQKGGNQ